MRATGRRFFTTSAGICTISTVEHPARCGLAALGNQTPAQPGDKTMMDALVPAVRAFTAAANSNQTVAEALHAASGAARAGAEATRDLVARYGRARHLGEKTRGHQDPGATSIGLIFEGLDRALAETPISGEDHDR
jgi:phosphoenolpyruvate---glycerone phosphotransferase subunit DhaL